MTSRTRERARGDWGVPEWPLAIGACVRLRACVGSDRQQALT